MQQIQAVKAVIVIIFMITFLSTYLYYSYSSKHLDILNLRPLRLTYGLNQVYILQHGYVPRDNNTMPFTSKSEETKILKGISENTTVIKALQYVHNAINVSNTTIKPHIPDIKSKGYILPYSIFEEQTNGASNLWQLQIWAKQVGMYVVEPFAKDSLFIMHGAIPKFNQSLRFGDYFDKEEWNRKVMKAGGNPLVEWEEFITDGPRDAIILHTLKEDNINPPLTIAYDENATVCNNGGIALNDMQWMKDNFNIIKTVCYLCSAKFQHPLSLEEFNSLIFSNNSFKPSQVTVIVVNWIGIRTSRVHLNPITIYTSPNSQKLLSPSKRVMAAYKAYVQQYIGDHKYVGIVFRTHHVMFFSPLKGSFANQSKHLLECSKRLSNVLDKIRQKWKIFLAYDMGKFGSKKYVRDKRLAPLQKQIFLDVFNGSLQANEREEQLINAANGMTDRGLIAQLEKVIATNADCIILLGPRSSFIRSSGSMYISQHISSSKCVVSICAEKVHYQNNIISSNSIPDSFIKD